MNRLNKSILLFHPQIINAGNKVLPPMLLQHQCKQIHMHYVSPILSINMI